MWDHVRSTFKKKQFVVHSLLTPSPAASLGTPTAQQQYATGWGAGTWVFSHHSYTPPDILISIIYTSILCIQVCPLLSLSLDIVYMYIYIWIICIWIICIDTDGDDCNPCQGTHGTTSNCRCRAASASCTRLGGSMPKLVSLAATELCWNLEPSK